MPISSGAGGKAARLHINVGGKSRSYWPNVTTATATATASSGGRTVTSGAAKSQSTSALHQQPATVNERPSGVGSSSPSSSSLSLSSAINLSEPVLGGPRVAVPSSQRAMSANKHKQAAASTHKHHKPRTATVEKYKQIRHISPPSPRATTSATAFKYFTGGDRELGAGPGLVGGQNIEEAENQGEQQANNKTRTGGGSGGDDSAGQGHGARLRQQLPRLGKKSKGKRANKMISSLGGQLVLTGGLQSAAPPPPPSTTTTTKTVHTNHEPTTQRPERSGLFSSLTVLGGTNQRATAIQQHQTASQLQMKSGQHHYPTINQLLQHNSSQTSANPSLSLGGGSGQTSSASSSAANLASLHGLQSRSTQGLTSNATSATTMISKRINLKYVKTLIILLMSLDLAVTLFVYHFASHDEFSLIFTQHKLRFSLINLVLSAIWFVVLAGAILFDVYAILLIGALVDIASFILLLVCSIIHFMHRIDYNSVNLTSLLLLLFSIIVLHVYLIVIAALTIYLMMAVKRRRRKH